MERDFSFSRLRKHEVIGMTVEQIAIRQEVRQMLNEAGINKNTLKEMVSQVISEEIQKACLQVMNERDMETMIARRMDNSFTNTVQDIVIRQVRDEVSKRFRSMSVTVDVRDENGTSSISHPGRFI